jgi:hypothetical protein
LKWKIIRFAVSLAIAAAVFLPVQLFLHAERFILADMSAEVIVAYSMLIPPTVTTDGGATNIAITDARLRGDIIDTGNENPDVWLFWGETDGGTDPLSWSDNANLGIFGVGSFYVDYFGIFTANTTYYYQVEAINSAGTGWAESSANFTTYAWGEYIMPPDDFTVIDLGAITLGFSWRTGVGANYTMVRGLRDSYPDKITIGELIYYGSGESVNSTGFALDVTRYKFSAWGFWSDNTSHSADYARAEVGGDAMTDIAIQIGELSKGLSGLVNALGGFIYFLPLIVFSVLAFWKENYILFMITASISFMVGYYTPNIISGAYETTSTAIAIGMALMIYGFLCSGWAFALMVRDRGREAEE